MKYTLTFANKESYIEAEPNLSRPYLAVTKEDGTIYFNGHEPNTSVFYKIEDNVLYIRGTEQEGYLERVLYTDTTQAKNGWYTDTNKGEITKAVIEETIYPTSCARFFDSCSGMTTIENFGKLKMDECESCFCMFQSCNVLEEVNCTNWNVSNVTDMTGIFNMCYELTLVGSLSKWDISKVANIRNAFNKCYKLTDIGDIGNWNVSNVTNMRYTFYNCSGLTSIGDLDNWNVSNVTDMCGMFTRSIKLKSLGDLSNWNISKVNDTSNMFSWCYELTSLGDLGNWDTSNVVDMTNMFAHNDRLAFIGDLTNWNVSNVESLYQTFGYAPLLENIGDLSKWNTSKVTVMSSMFNGINNIHEASRLNNIGLPPISQDCATESMLYSCGSLSNIIACGKISHYLRFYNSPLTHESALKVLNALDPEVNNTVVFPTTVYDALSADDIKIATDKGWTVQRL